LEYLVLLVGRDQWHLPPDEVVKRPFKMFAKTLAMIQAEAEVEEKRYAKFKRN
jgi:hypothetical protein